MHKHQLSDQFERFAADLSPQVVPAGPDAVRTTVRRRRRLAAASTAVAAVVLVGGPVLGYTALDRRANPDHVAVDPTTDVSPDLSNSPPAPRPTPTVADILDGRIGSEELSNAWLTLPAWPVGAPAACKTANVRLADAGIAHRVELTSLGYADVDGDPAIETIGVLSCKAETPAIEQAVVFDRDPAGITTGPQVINTDTSGVAWLIAVEAGPDGTVRLQVGDRQPCCGWQQQWIQRQWRAYRLAGDAFTLVEGRGKFDPNPHQADLSVTVSERLRLTRSATDGQLHGVVTVTVRNAGPAAVDGAQFAFDFGNRDMRPEGGGWSVCRDPRGVNPHCRLGPIPSGRTVTLELGLVTGYSNRYTGTATVTVARIADNGAPPEPDDGNNVDSLAYGA